MTGTLPPMPIGRLVRSIDFERVLSQRSRLQSTHFALHHLADRPAATRKPVLEGADLKLSTETEPMLVRSVDDFHPVGPEPRAEALSRPLGAGLWIGTVVPKRHARRAVTRTLLKRQIHAAVTARAAAMAGGMWVIRLRAGFERTAFPSAASAALRGAARAELDGLLARCSEPVPGAAKLPLSVAAPS